MRVYLGCRKYCMDIVSKYLNIYGRDIQKDFDRFNVLDRLSDNKDYTKRSCVIRIRFN